ncbi:MAG: zinc-binding dehydrogenase [Acidimicrobiales bacterium]|nr:zinc-binding dehydrogenase [Acidimicrobiales bacterium]
MDETQTPGPDQLLIRIDAVGLCFSDVKLVKQGGDHPKLYGRDLKIEPTRLGHEASVTVIDVGSNLVGKYQKGQRLAIQPDIHVDGKSTAYGYTIPGGLIQYHLIGPEVLDADDGAYVIPVSNEVGYAAAALSEPWACVEAAYTQRRRLSPATGGVMWIIGKPDDTTEYEFSSGLEAPSTIVVSDVSSRVRDLIARHNPTAEIVERNGLSADGYETLAKELTNGAGFDDIVVLDPRSASQMEEIAKLIAFRGTMNLVGTTPLDGKPQLDVGRLHYHYTAYVGTTGPDIAAAYGEARNRADLLPGGTTVFVGAGGPMGQMHMQRAIESENGPNIIIGSDLDDGRLDVARVMLADLAKERGKELVLINSSTSTETLQELVMRMTDGNGADDVVVTVPVGPVMGEAAELMGKNGMLVLFAGVANGTMAPLNLSNVYLHNAQLTGTSGSSIEDQAMVLQKAVEGKLSPDRSLAAVGGIEAGRDGVQAMLEGRFAGKIMIFPQLTGLPLTGLADLAKEHPDIGAAMAPGHLWTDAAEDLLLEKFRS